MANVHVLSLFSSIDILNRYLVFGKVLNNAGWYFEKLVFVLKVS